MTVTVAPTAEPAAALLAFGDGWATALAAALFGGLVAAVLGYGASIYLARRQWQEERSDHALDVVLTRLWELLHLLDYELPDGLGPKNVMQDRLIRTTRQLSEIHGDLRTHQGRLAHAEATAYVRRVTAHVRTLREAGVVLAVSAGNFEPGSPAAAIAAAANVDDGFFRRTRSELHSALRGSVLHNLTYYGNHLKEKTGTQYLDPEVLKKDYGLVYSQ